MTARRAVPSADSEGLKYNIRAIGRAIQVMNSFSRERSRLTLDEITRETGLSKPTAFRILATLQLNRYVLLDPADGRYRLGSIFLTLGAAALGSVSLREVSRPHLPALRDALQTTILVGTLMDDLLVYLDKLESPGPVRIAADIGWRRDPPAFGMLGMTLLAFRDDGEVSRILKTSPLAAYTSDSITDEGQFLARLGEIREKGYALEFGEAIEGVWGVAAPILNAEGATIAALGAALPISARTGERVAEAVSRVRETAGMISRELGCRAL